MRPNETEHEAAERAPIEAPRPKSRGEKWFDRFVYGALAGVGTFIATLYMANKFKNGDWAGPRYQKAVTATKDFLGKFMSSTASGKVADEVVQTTSLMMGGNAMLIPIGIAEHYKIPIVNGLNTALGDPTPPEMIEKAPRQTWASLIEGRLLAWAAVFVAFVGARFAIPKSFTMYCHEVGERSHQLTSWITRKPRLTGNAMEATTSYRIGNMGALDVFATMAAATLLYVGGHFFARKQEEKKEQRHGQRASQNAPVHAAQPEAASSSPQAPETAPDTRIHAGAHQREGTLGSTMAPALVNA